MPEPGKILSAKAGEALRWWAQPRLTIAFFILAALAAVALTQTSLHPTLVMWVPFLLLVINLVAAVLVTPRFRTDIPLLVFHLALLCLIFLFAIGRLTYLEGRALLTQDAAFSGIPDEVRHGPWHGDRIGRIRFANLGITEVYPKFNDFRHTYNTVMWWDASGQPQVTEIGDDKPLIVEGFRIFASRNRGVSPILSWQPADGGPPQRGSLQLGQRFGDVFENAVAWKLPDGQDAWLALEARAEQPAAPAKETVDMGVYELDHVLVLRIGASRHLLRKGESIDLGAGRLTYERLLTWMGYRIVYDPTIPWIIGTIGVGIASLIWYYIRRVFAKPLELST